MAVLTPSPKMQFFTAAGVPLSGGKVYTYAAGTTTPQATYTDNTGTTPNTNPIILDSRGEANIWLGATVYKFRLTDTNDVDIWTVDYISAPISSVSPVLSGNVVIDSDTPTPALTITQVGAGAAIRVQDSSDPDATPFLVDAAGNVGIGTASPAQKLDVFDGLIRVGGNVQGKLLGYSSTNVYTMDLGVSVGTGAAADVGFFNRAVGNAVFGTSNTERMRIDSNGNVGVGNTAANVSDQVGGVRPLLISRSDTATTIAGSLASIVVGNSDTTTSNTAQIGFAALTGANTTYFTSAAINCVFGARTNGQYPAGQLVFSTSSTLNAAPTEKMRLDSAGNLLFNSGYGSVATAYGTRAWVNFNGTGAVAIRASGNVTSITDNGTGDYTINFTNALPDVNYSPVGLTRRGSVNTDLMVALPVSGTFSTSALQVVTVAASDGVTKLDADIVSIHVTR